MLCLKIWKGSPRIKSLNLRKHPRRLGSSSKKIWVSHIRLGPGFPRSPKASKARYPRSMPEAQSFLAKQICATHGQAFLSSPLQRPCCCSGRHQREQLTTMHNHHPQGHPGPPASNPLSGPWQTALCAALSDAFLPPLRAWSCPRRQCHHWLDRTSGKRADCRRELLSQHSKQKTAKGSQSQQYHAPKQARNGWAAWNHRSQRTWHCKAPLSTAEHWAIPWLQKLETHPGNNQLLIAASKENSHCKWRTSIAFREPLPAAPDPTSPPNSLVPLPSQHEREPALELFLLLVLHGKKGSMPHTRHSMAIIAHDWCSWLFVFACQGNKTYYGRYDFPMHFSTNVDVCWITMVTMGSWKRYQKHSGATPCMRGPG